MTTNEDLKYSAFYKGFEDKTESEIADKFTQACYTFDLELLKCFLKFPKLREIKGVYGVENYVYKWGCIGNRLDIIDYVLTSPDLKEHADMHFQNDFWLKNALKEKAYGVIHYFIFYLNIEITEDMIKHLTESPDKKVEYFLSLRGVNKELNMELPTNNIKDKQNKI